MEQPPPPQGPHPDDTPPGAASDFPITDETNIWAPDHPNKAVLHVDMSKGPP